MRDRDPGARWADELLSSLRREQVDLDVSPAVMARVVASRGGAATAIVLPKPPALAWATCFVSGVSALAILATTLYALLLGRDEGLRQAWALGGALGRLGIVLVDTLARLGGGILTASGAFLRGAWVILETAAPLIRGAGTLAVICGLLSIVFSLLVFARARRTAPAAGFQGGIR